MKPATIMQILASVLMVSVVTVSLIGAEYLQQQDPLIMPSDADEIQLPSSNVKRPFCNAFTGCGRKRSEEPMNGATDIVNDGEGSPSDLLFLKKLGRHILRMKAAVASQLHENNQNQPWNNYNTKNIQKNQLRTPWIDYIVDRKKRSMAVVDHHSTGVGDVI